MIGSLLRDGLNNFLAFVSLAVLIGQVVALVDAAMRRDDAYRAADKLTKPGWLIILTVGIAANVVLGLLGTIAGVVAAMVYWVDVRPALKELNGRNRDKSGSNRGPYGGW